MWELVVTVIIPIITYGSESWEPKKKEMTQIDTTARSYPNCHPTSGNRTPTNWIGSQKEENHARRQSTNQRKNGLNTTNNKRWKPMERRNKNRQEEYNISSSPSHWQQVEEQAPKLVGWTMCFLLMTLVPVQKLCVNIYMYICICMYILYTSSVIGRIYNGSVIQYWRSCTPSRSLGLFLGSARFLGWMPLFVFFGLPIVSCSLIKV